jgi:hypothetical protein
MTNHGQHIFNIDLEGKGLPILQQLPLAHQSTAAFENAVQLVSPTAATKTRIKGSVRGWYAPQAPAPQQVQTVGWGGRASGSTGAAARPAASKPFLEPGLLWQRGLYILPQQRPGFASAVDLS